MKYPYTCALFFSIFSLLNAQYTDQINSNRPGASIGAFAVGKNVIQAEAGVAFRHYTHSGYNNSTFTGGVGFLSMRWGFFMETLELTYEGQYLFGNLISKLATTPINYKRNGFLQNFLGIKYLVYDPFKKEKKVSVISWKANNGFKLRELIPAVSITVGANTSPKNNPYPYNNIFSVIYRPVFFQNFGAPLEQEPRIHTRATLATQSHFLRTWVFVTNSTYDRFLSDYPEFNYIFTLTHTLDPLWSVYIEHQRIQSDLFKDQLFRMGAAYLYSNNMQIEASIGTSIKNTPHQLLANLGVSYRLDFHKDFLSAQ